MILKAIIEDQVYTLNVPEPILERGSELFDQLDRDMDRGWQMSRDWVDNPSPLERCQIVANKLLTALEKENHKLGMLMAGYILSRMPDVESVELDTRGEIQNNHFNLRTETSDGAQAPGPAAADPAVPHPPQVGASADAGRGLLGAADASPSGLTKIEAMSQAGQDVTKVFKVGKAWQFSVYDHGSGTWQGSPPIATEQEAERLRQLAFKERYEALQRRG
jgi:DNA-directed RNA polymerase subunit L